MKALLSDGSLIWPQHQEKQTAGSVHTHVYQAAGVQTSWSGRHRGHFLWEARDLRPPTGLAQDMAPGKRNCTGLLPSRADTRQVCPARPCSSQTVHVCSAWLVPKLQGWSVFGGSSPMAPKGKRTLVFIFITAELLTSYKSHQPALPK